MKPKNRTLLLVGVGVGVGVVALGLIGLNMAVMLPLQRSGALRSSRMTAMELRRAAETWRTARPNAGCPTPALLRADHAIDPASKIEDAWGSPLRIVCAPDETAVMSDGPDRRADTSDDIRVPERAMANGR